MIIQSGIQQDNKNIEPYLRSTTEESKAYSLFTIFPTKNPSSESKNGSTKYNKTVQSKN